MLTLTLTIDELLLLFKEDEETLFKLDRQIAHSLAFHFNQRDKSIFKLCFILAHRDIERVLLCQDVAFLLIERYLEPEVYIVDAIEALNHLNSRKIICSPVWHYLSRCSYRFSNDYSLALDKLFPLHPDFFSEVASRSDDLRFLSHVVTELTKLVPFIKFMPPTPLSHEHIREHDSWSRIGKAYIDILNFANKKQKKYDLCYLKERFLNTLTMDEHLWLNRSDDKVKKLFLKQKSVYLDLMD